MDIMSKYLFTREIRLKTDSIIEVDDGNENYKNISLENKNLLKKAHSNFEKNLIPPFITSLLLSLSLRRYLNQFVKNFYFFLSSDIIILNMAFLSSFNFHSIPLYFEDTRPVFKNLIMEENEVFLKYLKRKYRLNQDYYLGEDNFFRQFLKKEELEKWKSYQKKYPFENFSVLNKRIDIDIEDIENI